MMDLTLDLLPTQEEFYFSEAKYPAYIGGFGAGKTRIGAIKAIVLSLTNAPLPGMIVSATYRDLRDTFIPEIEERLDALGIIYKLHKTNFDLTIPGIGGKIMLRSGDEPESLKGPNVAWAGIDEVARVDEALWGILVSRVRHPKARQRQLFVTGTPEGYNWVYERWKEKPKPGYVLFTASSRENFFLPDDYVDSLEDSLSGDEVIQKVEGQFADTAKGYVYAGHFGHENVTEICPFTGPSEEGQRYSKHLPLSLMCDFNVGYARWLIGQERNGVFWVGEELALDNVYTDTMIEEFKRRGHMTHPSGVQVYGDASGYSRNTAAASGTDYDLMRQAGLKDQRVPKANPAVKDRIMAVTGKLKNGKGERNLFIHPDCKELILDLQRVKWTKGSTTQLDKGSDPARTHASDALGYWIAEKTPLHSWTPQSGHSNWL